jgi:hypothetical protein
MQSCIYIYIYMIVVSTCICFHNSLIDYEIVWTVWYSFDLRIECILLKFHTPKTLQKNAFNSYSYILITPKFSIVEFFVVNFISVRLFAVGNYYAIDCLHLTCKFGFEFHWDMKHHFYNHVTTS